MILLKIKQAENAGEVSLAYELSLIAQGVSPVDARNRARGVSRSSAVYRVVKFLQSVPIEVFHMAAMAETGESPRAFLRRVRKSWPLSWYVDAVDFDQGYWVYGADCSAPDGFSHEGGETVH